jgi:hypothetical protein
MGTVSSGLAARRTRGYYRRLSLWAREQQRLFCLWFFRALTPARWCAAAIFTAGVSTFRISSSTLPQAVIVGVGRGRAGCAQAAATGSVRLYGGKPHLCSLGRRRVEMFWFQRQRPAWARAIQVPLPALRWATPGCRRCHCLPTASLVLNDSRY